MSILSRYIMVQFLRMAGICQAGAITLFMMAEFIERIDDLIEKKAAFIDGVLYFLFKIPQLVIFSIPLTVLLACVFSLVLLSRGNEIVAMRSCGASIYRVVTPILISSFVIAILTFFANEYIVPYSNQRANHIWEVRVKKIAPRGYNRTDKIWYRSEDNTIWHITHFDPFKDRMRNVTIYRLDKHDRLIQRIDAQHVRWIPTVKRWLFSEGLVHYFTPDGAIRQEPFDAAHFPLRDQPADFKKTGKKPEEMNWAELRDYIKIMQTSGVDSNQYTVDLWAKLSTPFICFILALVGVPFSLKTSRAGGIVLGIAITIGIGASFLVLFYMGISLGHAGRLPPILAAWGPNLLFLAGGSYLLTHVRG